MQNIRWKTNINNMIEPTTIFNGRTYCLEIEIAPTLASLFLNSKENSSENCKHFSREIYNLHSLFNNEQLVILWLLSGMQGYPVPVVTGNGGGPVFEWWISIQMR